MSISYTNSTAKGDDVVLRWQVHLARKQPYKLIGAGVAVVAMAVVAHAWFGSLLPAVVMIFVLAGALSDFLFPVTYTLTSTHASAQTPVSKQVISWDSVRTCYLDELGVKLSPLGKRSRMEAYRGVYLRFGENREEILDAVTRLRPQDG